MLCSHEAGPMQPQDVYAAKMVAYHDWALVRAQGAAQNRSIGRENCDGVAVKIRDLYGRVVGR